MPVSSEFRRIYARSAARRKPAPEPCWCGSDHAVKAGHSAREWLAMVPPDSSTQPARYREWLSWSTHKEQPVTTQPSSDAIRQWGEHARAVTPVVVRIVGAYNKRVARIRRMADVDPATKDQLLALARRIAADELAPVKADFTRAKEAVNDLTQRAMAPKPMDAASEQRITRAWNRIERILDRAPAGDRLSIIEQQLTRAKATGDESALRALWENAPGYAEADERDDRGREEAARLRDTLVKIAAPEEAARAHTQRQAFDAGSYRVGISLAEAEHILSGDAGIGGGSSLLPGYGADELHELQDESPAEKAESSEARLRSLMP